VLTKGFLAVEVFVAVEVAADFTLFTELDTAALFAVLVLFVVFLADGVERSGIGVGTTGF